MKIYLSKKSAILLKILLLLLLSQNIHAETDPLVVVTWNFPEATQKAWRTLSEEKRSALDAVEEGCKICEQIQCDGAVGFGGKSDENGETTLDALIMDGTTMDIGAVGGIRNVKDAISVARKVMENTRHSLLGGSLATDFAVQMGFKKESLQDDRSYDGWQNWRSNNCQPNFWENVEPNPSMSCGPYHLEATQSDYEKVNPPTVDENNHDTIGVLALDIQGRIAAATSTNGQNYKIPGRIADSALSGSGAYADGEVGAAAATGDGDIMMRFLPSYLSVELMRLGASPNAATETAVRRIAKYYPKFRGAVIALNKAGEYGANCYGYDSFPYYIANVKTGAAKGFNKICIKTHSP